MHSVRAGGAVFSEIRKTSDLVRENLSIPVTKECKLCDESHKVWLGGNSSALITCPHCNGTGKSTKTIKEIIEEWMK